MVIFTHPLNDGQYERAYIHRVIKGRLYSFASLNRNVGVYSFMPNTHKM